MNSLTQHAKAELRAAGMFDDDSDFDGAIGVSVMSLIETLAAYGHSGGSLIQTVDIFNKLANRRPLTPLTGEDDEWEIPNGMGGQLMMNKRCNRVFKDDDMAWDVRGLNADGTRKPITFPYTPK